MCEQDQKNEGHISCLPSERNIQSITIHPYLKQTMSWHGATGKHDVEGIAIIFRANIRAKTSLPSRKAFSYRCCSFTDEIHCSSDITDDITAFTLTSSGAAFVVFEQS